MKRAHRLIIIASVASLALVAVVAAVIAYQAYAAMSSEWYPEDAIKDGPPDVLLDSIQVGERTAQFYIDYSRDCAVFGFFLEDETGRPRYFPVSGSTHRGLDRMTVNVFLSDTQEEMWVLIAPPPSRHYFHAANDFVLEHGYDVATPASFSTHSSGPPLPPEAKKVLSFTIGEDY